MLRVLSLLSVRFRQFEPVAKTDNPLVFFFSFKFVMNFNFGIMKGKDIFSNLIHILYR